VPVKEAGCLIEPPVSVPIVIGVKLAANAEADPPVKIHLEPNLYELDFEHFQKKLVSLDDPIANSSQFNLPSRIAPSFQIF